MFEVTLADSRTALADTDNPEDLALILEGTKAFFSANIRNPNAPAFKVKEAVAMRQALRIVALESLVAEQGKLPDGLNSDFATLHEDLAYGEADLLSEDQLKAAAGCVLSCRIYARSDLRLNVVGAMKKTVCRPVAASLSPNS